MKVALVAYACEPDSGSEPGVGWNIACELARRHEVWVVTRRNNRSRIEAALKDREMPKASFAYHDIGWAAGLKRGRWAVYPYHYLWQMSVYRVVAELHARVGFDVAHQITFGSYRFPSSLQRLGIPYVLGPLGGAEEAPLAFWWGLGLRGAAAEALRWLSNRAALLDPFVRRSLGAAAITLCASPDTEEFVRRHFRAAGNVRLLASIGINPELALAPEATSNTTAGPLRALFVGRLEPWKGLHLALAAVVEARGRGRDVTLTVLGVGSAGDRLASSPPARQLGEAVNWIGRVPSMADVRDLYQSHHVLVFPSLHESGGMAVVEAMACGLPVLCLRLGGPGLSVDDASGILVEPTRPRQVIRAIADALVRLAGDRRAAWEMGQAAQRRAFTEYSWTGRAEQISRIHALATGLDA